MTKPDDGATAQAAPAEGWLRCLDAAARVPAAELRARLAAFQRRLQERGLAAALVRQNADLYYLAGTVQDSFLWVPCEGEARLFTARVPARARAESALPVVAVDGLDGFVAALRERHGEPPRRLGLELDVLPVRHCRRLLAALGEPEAEDVGRDLVRQRAVKSPWEVERVRAAAALADAVWERAADLFEAGLSEAAFAGRVEAEARALGHEGVIRMRGFNQEMFYGQLLVGVSGTVPSFLDTPLAGPGLSPAVAQGVSMRPVGRDEPVLFDFVAVRHGYIADFTRMLVAGEAPAAVRRAYDVARRVQAAAGAAARPGASCAAVWEAARAVADEAGLGRHFMGYGETRVPYVGHGVGLELDELPVLTGSRFELREGMVFALEPKFVLPGLGAVGIENTWLVTADGPEPLTVADEALRCVAP